jgi:hypothetical protein
MPLIHEPQCPVCGSTLPLRTLWQFARLEESRVLWSALSFLDPRSGLLRGKIGIACPNCRAKFEVVQTRIRIVRFLAWGLIFVCLGTFGAWNRHAHLVTDQRVMYGLSLVVTSALLWSSSYLTPYLAQVRSPRDDERLSFPLRSAYDGPADSESEP